MPPKKNDITISKDTKKVNNKQTKLSKESKSKESENEESEDSENEESENEDSENEESEESEESEKSENEEKDKSKKSVKEKKVKKTKEENINELTQLIVDFKKNESEYKLIQENFHKNEKARSEIGKQLSRIVSLLQKSNDSKPKREGNNTSGFNKETPVPPKLIKYLSLDNDVLMSRPKLGSLLYQKFKSENLTNGQNITLDKNTAKIFGKEKDYEFNFKQMQTFIKEIYDEAFPKS
jgi:hypothetical protein